MHLAFKRTAASKATFLQRLYCKLIRWRLASEYCHGGIVVNGAMYHVTAVDGLHVSDYEPEKWQLYDLGSKDDTWLLSLFDSLQGAKYNWLGILDFELPFILRDRRKFYCFEWCFLAMRGNPETTNMIAPERLLTLLLKDKNNGI